MDHLAIIIDGAIGLWQVTWVTILVQDKLLLTSIHHKMALTFWGELPVDALPMRAGKEFSWSLTFLKWPKRVHYGNTFKNEALENIFFCTKICHLTSDLGRETHRPNTRLNSVTEFMTHAVQCWVCQHPVIIQYDTEIANQTFLNLFHLTILPIPNNSHDAPFIKKKTNHFLPMGKTRD